VRRLTFIALLTKMKVSTEAAMDEQTSERISAMEDRMSMVETDVAIIRSNYVKRDEFAGLRADNAVAFGEVQHQFGEMQLQFGEVQHQFGEVQRQFGEVRAEIAQLATSMLKWIVATDIALFMAIVATIRYMH
jgi:septation ring formation regulator EzrA